MDTLSSRPDVVAKSDAQLISERRDDLRRKIRQHHQWYQKAKNTNRNLYYAFQILSLLCGFAASTLAAVDPSWGRTGLILLPILASILASLIHQFSWRELYELREQGRIDMEELLLETKHSRPTNLDGMTALEADVHRRLIEVSRRQASGFFTFVKDDHDRTKESKGMPPAPAS
jgi:hypothetical protein